MRSAHLRAACPHCGVLPPLWSLRVWQCGIARLSRPDVPATGLQARVWTALTISWRLGVYAEFCPSARAMSIVRRLFGADVSLCVAIPLHLPAYLYEKSQSLVASVMSGDR